MPEARPSTPSVLKACLSSLVIFGVLFFAIIAMNTRDPLWFWPVFKEIPVGILVHCYGTDVEVQPGEPAFEAVTQAVNASLTGRNRWDELSMSDETYQEYQTSPTMMVVELSYDPPVTIHSMDAFFKDVDIFIVPLDGRHASTNAIFGMERGFIDPGSLHVKSTAPIVTALQELGICTKP